MLEGGDLRDAPLQSMSFAKMFIFHWFYNNTTPRPHPKHLSFIIVGLYPLPVIPHGGPEGQEMKGKNALATFLKTQLLV